VNWTKGFDERTGKAILNQDSFYDTKTTVRIYPGGGGAHNWSPMSYNPNTGLVYLPASYGSYTFTSAEEATEAPGGHHGLSFGRGGGEPRTPSPILGPEPPNGRGGGVLEARDPVTQKVVWQKPGGGAAGGGTLTTAGNLVFQVLGDGRLLAYSADEGEQLLELRTDKGGAGPPITYLIDGQQYVAFLAGAGRPAQTVGPNDAKVENPPMLFVFEVGGTAALPPPVAPANPFAPKPAPPEQELHK
jgi:quinohemoprotein ethanol dehydrogenase